MYCKNCGQPFTGNFCAQCGKPKETTSETLNATSSCSLVGRRWILRSFTRITTDLTLEGDTVVGSTNYHGHILHRRPQAISFQVSELKSVSHSLKFVLYFADILRVTLAIALSFLSWEFLILVPAFLVFCFFSSLTFHLKNGRSIQIPASNKSLAFDFLKALELQSGCKLP